MSSYADTRERLETYFDRTAAKTWEALTSDAPVSRIRQTVREGRDEMRMAILDRLPDDLSGKRILDAGAGAGQVTEALARRGAAVVAADISPSLLDVAKRRIPEVLHDRIEFRAGDMLDEGLGQFDHIVAMDSLIHYKIDDIGDALAQLGARCETSMVFTIAPSTTFLKAFWMLGQVFPRSDRSPQIIPHSDRSLQKAVSSNPVLTRFMLGRVRRVSRGFYISQAMELAR